MSETTVDAHGRNFGQWDTMSIMYAKAIGRMTTAMVAELVEWVDGVVPLDGADSKVMDNGCGTGALGSVLKSKHPDIDLIGTDISAGMIDKVCKTAEESGWTNFAAQVLDARKLSSIETNSMTHVFSSFMICLAPDPEQIAGEMHRVLKPSGVLGLAVWGEPYFRYWEEPWTKACREIDPAYSPPMIMDPEWTYAENVRKRLERAGFQSVDTRTKAEPFHWEKVDQAVIYFFDEHNPKNEEYLASWTERGMSRQDIRPVFKTKLEEAYGGSDGSLEGYVSVCLAIGRK